MVHYQHHTGYNRLMDCDNRSSRLITLVSDALLFHSWYRNLNHNWHFQLNFQKSPGSKTVNNTGSCFGFRVPVSKFQEPVVCNASLFCVMRQCITQHVWGGGGWAHYGKKVAHYKKRWRITKNWYPKPANWYPKPQLRTTAIAVLPGSMATKYLAHPFYIRLIHHMHHFAWEILNPPLQFQATVNILRSLFKFVHLVWQL